jgi:hypothetical protein
MALASEARKRWIMEPSSFNFVVESLNLFEVPASSRPTSSDETTKFSCF